MGVQGTECVKGPGLVKDKEVDAKETDGSDGLGRDIGSDELDGVGSSVGVFFGILGIFKIWAA